MGFTVTKTLTFAAQGLELANTHVTLKGRENSWPQDLNGTVTVETAGTASSGMVQRIPLLAADHFGTSGTGAYWTWTEGDDSQYAVWYNVDAGHTAPTTVGLTQIAVALTASDDASTVVTKTAAALIAAGHLATVSNGSGSSSMYSNQSQLRLTNTTNGNVALADVSTMPRYRRSVYSGNYQIYATKGASQPLESGGFSVSLPYGNLPAKDNLKVLYERLKQEARWVGFTVDDPDV